MLVLVRFADLTLKGRNMSYFVRQVNKHLKNILKEEVSNFDFRHDQTYLTINEEDFSNVANKLSKVPGIHSFSPIYRAENEEVLVDLAVEKLESFLKDTETTFKIETKRSNKKYPLTSLEFTKSVAPKILGKANIRVKIQVKNPQITLNIDLRKDGIYFYLETFKGLGGFPATTAGKGLLMLSGGIDSPVAGFLAMKQGIDIELFHFESTPMTPLESVQKAIDLAKKLALFHPNQKLKLHLVPFTKLHEAILSNTFDSYHITIMRRMMYKISSLYAIENGLEVIINGESVGQVASQTLASMNVIESVTNIPIIRPVVTYDKQEIIKISKQIDTYDISIRAYNDCCSIYVPKNPVIRPTIKKALFEESKFEYESYFEDILNNIVTIEVDTNLDFEISLYGFSVIDAYDNYRSAKDDN